MGSPNTKSTWKKQFGTLTESVCAPDPNVAVSESNRTCWLAVLAEKVAAGALYETSES